ncbi:hypothetical protein HMI55_007186 [Coelomomyces lativittatus]|nr:hypothetical protein HMI56_004882 [Coelomomyces lativittatus]KAJ1509962.1 hypothetical protein HMI55_007186 [Coelomomyces lativittatus]
MGTVPCAGEMSNLLNCWSINKIESPNCQQAVTLLLQCAATSKFQKSSSNTKKDFNAQLQRLEIPAPNIPRKYR